MRFGDLSNKVAPRAYIVWEGCLAYLPESNATEFAEITSKRHVDWQKAIRLWEPNDLMIKKLSYLAWTKDINFTVVTWLPKDAAYGLDMFMEKYAVIAGLVTSTPEEMAKELVNRPDVVAIYDPVPEHVLTFGSKARVISEPSDLGRQL